jgi:hypothetical protein
VAANLQQQLTATTERIDRDSTARTENSLRAYSTQMESLVLRHEAALKADYLAHMLHLDGKVGAVSERVDAFGNKLAGSLDALQATLEAVRLTLAANTTLLEGLGTRLESLEAKGDAHASTTLMTMTTRVNEAASTTAGVLSAAVNAATDTLTKTLHGGVLQLEAGLETLQKGSTLTAQLVSELEHKLSDAVFTINEAVRHTGEEIQRSEESLAATMTKHVMSPEVEKIYVREAAARSAWLVGERAKALNAQRGAGPLDDTDVLKIACDWYIKRLADLHGIQVTEAEAIRWLETEVQAAKGSKPKKA